TSSTLCQICSSCAVCRAMFVPTTARSSSPRSCGSGLQLSAQGPPSSNPEAHRRTAIARASTQSYADELLNGEIFYSLAEAKIIIKAWRRYYNTERPYSSLGYKPPAPA